MAHVKMTFEFDIPEEDSIWITAREKGWSQQDIAWAYFKAKAPKMSQVAMAVTLEPRGVAMQEFRES
jgi:hypothetical protein